MPELVLLAGLCGLGAAALLATAWWDARRERQAVRERMWPWWPYDEQDR